MSDEQRRVWIITLPTGVLLDPEGQILIEMFGEDPPTVAFRDNKWATWGPPHDAEEAP